MGKMISMLIMVCLAFLFCVLMIPFAALANPPGDQKNIQLPAPATSGSVSVETALQTRKSIRSYTQEPLSINEVSQLLWAAQGITRKNGMRTAPSAGALYPMEVYLVVGNVEDLAEGVYRYHPHGHEIERLSSEDMRRELARSALNQSCIQTGAVDIVLAAVYERTAVKYGSRAERYVHIEAGNIAQNIYLQAAGLGLGTVMVGAFDDQGVKRNLPMSKDEHPLVIMPVGRVP